MQKRSRLEPPQVPLHTAAFTPDKTNKQKDFPNQKKGTFGLCAPAACLQPEGTEKEQIGTAKTKLMVQTFPIGN